VIILTDVMMMMMVVVVVVVVTVLNKGWTATPTWLHGYQDYTDQCS
jgi:hypothetical protein